MSLTDLDGLRIGSTCATRAKSAENAAINFGMVVELGMHEQDGSPFVILLSEVPHREVRVQVYYGGAQKPKQPNVAKLRRVDLADIDPASVEEPIVSRMQGWAKKAMLGECVLPGETFALATIAGMLFQEARRLSAEQIEARRAEREAS